MLSMLREATRGWVAKILLVLLVASFAVWGVSGSILSGNTASVITVGDTRVTPIELRLAYDRQLNQLQRQFGTRLTREQADAFGLTGNVISQLVSGAVLDEAARKMKLGISSDRLAGIIGEDETFRDATGRFSRDQLRRALASIGMSEEEYVETRKAVALRNQIIEATAGETPLPDAYFDLLSAYQGEERKFDYVVISDGDIGQIADPDEAELKEYYEGNLDAYRAPEFRKLLIVKLEAADIADEAAISDEEIAAEYEARKASYSEPEKRTIQQLVFTSREEAEAAAQKLADGASFESLLAEQGKTAGDVSLGTLAKAGIPDTAIAEAAFAAALNTPTEPVDGLFGTAILNVTEIIPGSTKPLTEVAGEIRRTLALARAEDEIFETHDQLEDERAAGETLQKAAEIVGLKPRVIDAVDRTARDRQGNIISDIPQSQEVLSEAFEIDPGFEINAISIGTEGFVWVDVLEIEPERQKPFEEVREQVEADWLEAEKAKAVAALAETFRERLQSGGEFNSLIEELIPAGDGEAKKVVQQTQALNRLATAPGLPQPVIAAGFSQPEGSVVALQRNSPLDWVVLRVAAVNAGSSPVDEAARSAAAQQAGDDIVNQLISRLRQDETITINQPVIRQVLAQ
ncbi:peptidylprolyl isomerase [Salaquimonas pukyongi]|uniref:peptidylprolyl isomerase n=1 Tax=Salaquimonas pukyongi TaxID=2712698 RepID=UPI00096B6F24|nr:peptidylprolyl isomerase [Salaquimonas pukyongi]